MNTIAGYMTTDHKRCDDFFVEAENCVSSDGWKQAEALFAQFHNAIERHFAMEEKILFPAFESATGSSNGPTAVMRSEHLQIREIISDLVTALAKHDKSAYLGHSESLNIMLQQHNLKEENILYPMSARVLTEQQPELVEEMSRLTLAV